MVVTGYHTMSCIVVKTIKTQGMMNMDAAEQFVLLCGTAPTLYSLESLALCPC